MTTIYKLSSDQSDFLFQEFETHSDWSQSTAGAWTYMDVDTMCGPKFGGQVT